MGETRPNYPRGTDEKRGPSHEDRIRALEIEGQQDGLLHEFLEHLALLERIGALDDAVGHR